MIGLNFSLIESEFFLIGFDLSSISRGLSLFGRVGAIGDFCGKILTVLNFSLIGSEFFFIGLDLALISRGLSFFDREGLLVSVEFRGMYFSSSSKITNYIKKR